MAVVDTARWCNRTGLGTAASCWLRSQRWHSKLGAIELNARVGLSAQPYGSKGPLLQEENNSCLRRQPPNCVDVVKSLCQRGRLEEALGTLESMEQQGLLIPLEVYVMLLQECGKQKALVEARLVHGRLSRRHAGQDSHGYLWDQLVGVFVRCGSLPDASLALRSARGCSVSSWTVVIAAYCDSGQRREALSLYEHMLEAGLEPDRVCPARTG